MAAIRIPGLPDDHTFSDSGLNERVLAAVQDVTRTQPQREPPLRIGADLVFGVQGEDGAYRYYELVSGGTFLRDPETRALWPFPLGREILSDALPRLADADDLASESDDASPRHGE